MNSSFFVFSTSYSLLQYIKRYMNNSLIQISATIRNVLRLFTCKRCQGYFDNLMIKSRILTADD